MVKKMNKNKFIEKLQQETNYNKEKCCLINNILEQNFIFYKRNKQKIIYNLTLENFTEDESENIYDICIKIIKEEIKNKIKHPFKRKNNKVKNI